MHIPGIEDTKSVISPPLADNPKVESKGSMLDPNLFDIPQENKVASTQEDLSEKAWEDLQKLQAGGIEHKPPPERKLPWIIDIFLYPTSKAGLTMVAIFIMIPLLAEVLVRFLFSIPLYLIAVFFLILNLIVNVIILLYRYWYLRECIRNSSDGQIRAPDTIAITPGLAELFSAFFKIFACVIIFSAPIYYYLSNAKDIGRDAWSFFNFMLFFWWIVVSEVGKSGTTFHLLLLFAVFFFPMTVLSVVMSDSFRGLNPIRIVRSIFNTFAPYCGVVLLLCVLGVPAVLIRKFIITAVVQGNPGLSLYLPKAVSIYIMLIGAHLLGRFYWKYEEKLCWDV